MYVALHRRVLRAFLYAHLLHNCSVNMHRLGNGVAKMWLSFLSLSFFPTFPCLPFLFLFSLFFFSFFSPFVSSPVFFPPLPSLFFYSSLPFYFFHFFPVAPHLLKVVPFILATVLGERCKLSQREYMWRSFSRNRFGALGPYTALNI